MIILSKKYQRFFEFKKFIISRSVVADFSPRQKNREEVKEI